jgi:hypothetical protein
MMQMALRLLFNGQTAIVGYQSKFDCGVVYARQYSILSPLMLWLSGHGSSTFIMPSKASATEPNGAESLITAAYPACVS